MQAMFGVDGNAQMFANTQHGTSLARKLQLPETMEMHLQQPLAEDVVVCGVHWRAPYYISY